MINIQQRPNEFKDYNLDGLTNQRLSMDGLWLSSIAKVVSSWQIIQLYGHELSGDFQSPGYFEYQLSLLNTMLNQLSTKLNSTEYAFFDQSITALQKANDILFVTNSNGELLILPDKEQQLRCSYRYIWRIFLHVLEKKSLLIYSDREYYHSPNPGVEEC